MPSAQDLTPQERFDRYTTLLFQLKSIEKQLGELKEHLKTDLEHGAVLSNASHYARLKTSQSTSYDLQEFTAVFGFDVTYQVVSIDNKKVTELLKQGKLDEVQLLPLQHTRARTPALVIESHKSPASDSKLEPGSAA